MGGLDIGTALEWRGRTVIDAGGDKIGKLANLYLDDQERPAWASVKTGLFGTRESLVPLGHATAAGDDIQVPFTAQQVKDAPNVDPDVQLEPHEEELLFRHYGLALGPGASAGDAGHEADVAGAGGAAQQADAGVPAPDGVFGPAADAAPAEGGERRTEAEMVRHEEELRHVGTRHHRKRARLKRYVEEDVVQVEVPVRREKARIEYEPVKDAEPLPPRE